MVKLNKEDDFDGSDYELKKILMSMPKENIIERYFYKYDDLHKSSIIMMFIILIGGVIGGGFIGYGIGDTQIGEIKELGQAICEEEFDMIFDSYNDKELKCKVRDVIYEKQYDGIKIQIE